MGLPSLRQMCRLRTARHTHMDQIMCGTINLPPRLLQGSKERKTTMKYQVNLPQEPDGPLCDQDGRKYVKIGPKNASTLNECGKWELADPKGEKPYYTWAELLAKVEYLQENVQAIGNWQNSKIGGLYWDEGKEGEFLRDVKGVAIATQARTLRVPSTRDIFDDGILGEDDQDNFYEVTPVLAVPADDLIKLLRAENAGTIFSLQDKISDWLDNHPQVHWE